MLNKHSEIARLNKNYNIKTKAAANAEITIGKKSEFELETGRVILKKYFEILNNL